MENVRKILKTPLGDMLIEASNIGLTRLDLIETHFKNSTHKNPQAEKILLKTQQQLAEYFVGKRKEFTIPLDLKGTDFQLQVWSELQKIPYGSLCSYKDIAKNIKNVKATRAVGSANGKNPICIILACHRVITSSGHLGGYSGGLHFKRKLLKIEGSYESVKV